MGRYVCLAVLLIAGCSDTSDPAVSVSAKAIEISESGTVAELAITLATAPESDVRVQVRSTNTREAIVDIEELVFSAANWERAQTITVSGVDDPFADGDQTLAIEILAAHSDDTTYEGLDAPDVSAVNIDDDEFGFIADLPTSITTTEAGGKSSLSLRLNAEPEHPVRARFASADLEEGMIVPAELVFDRTNWNQPQTAIVIGVDDGFDDGPQPYEVTMTATSADARFASLAPIRLAATNDDDDTAGIIIHAETSLTTAESGGRAFVAVELASAPIGTVTIAVSTSNPAEGVANPSQLTFAPGDRGPQQIEIVGVDDNSADGTQPYTLVLGTASSQYADYNGLEPDDQIVNNLDDDTAGIYIERTPGLSGGFTTEPGGRTYVHVRLTTKPTNDVTVGFASSDPGEGAIDKSTLVFTPANWNAFQSIEVTGVDDNLADGEQLYKIVSAPATSNDADYNGLDAIDMELANVDREEAAIQISVTSIAVAEGGTARTFEIRLATIPTHNVHLRVSASRAGEVTISPSEVFWFPFQYLEPRIVTITSINDSLIEGTQTLAVNLVVEAVGAPEYDGLTAAVPVSNVDNDLPGLSFTTVTTTISESGAPRTLSFTLDNAPSAPVTFAVASSNLGIAIADPPSLTFTAANFNVAQIVNVRGIDDALVTNDRPFMLELGPATSADPNYSGFDPSDVAMISADDDDDGFIGVRNVTMNGFGIVGGAIILPATFEELTNGRFAVAFDTITPGNQSRLHRVRIEHNSGTWAERTVTTATGHALAPDSFLPSPPLIPQLAFSTVNVPGMGIGYKFVVRIFYPVDTGSAYVGTPFPLIIVMQ